jgi:pre-mRNA-splicing factor CWC26
MSSGAGVGLQTGQQVSESIRRRKEAEEAQLKKMDASMTGRYAETVHRDKQGRKMDVAAERARLSEEKRKKEADEEARMEWGKGAVQKQEKEDIRKQEMDMKLKPFARSVF